MTAADGCHEAYHDLGVHAPEHQPDVDEEVFRLEVLVRYTSAPGVAAVATAQRPLPDASSDYYATYDRTTQEPITLAEAEAMARVLAENWIERPTLPPDQARAVTALRDAAREIGELRAIALDPTNHGAAWMAGAREFRANAVRILNEHADRIEATR